MSPFMLHYMIISGLHTSKRNHITLPSTFSEIYPSGEYNVFKTKYFSKHFYMPLFSLVYKRFYRTFSKSAKELEWKQPHTNWCDLNCYTQAAISSWNIYKFCNGMAKWQDLGIESLWFVGIKTRWFSPGLVLFQWTLV